MLPAYTYANESSQSNPIENLLRLKQQLVLEHMAGNGGTPLQRELKKRLKKKQIRHNPRYTSNSEINPEQKINNQLCAFWKQQSDGERRNRKLEQHCK